MIPELYPFQCDLVNRTAQAATQGAKRIIVQGATGSGKTNVAAYIIRRAANKGSDALFMVHRRKLVDQISSRLHDFEVQHGIIMRDEAADRGCRVQVASRDTLVSRSLNNCWSGMPPAKLVVVDEGHHAADSESEYRRILWYYEQQGATILLLTATPVGRDGQGMGPWAQALVCAAPTTQLVREGYLCPVTVYAPERKTKGKRLLRGIAGDLVESWKQYAEGQPTILFCSRLSHSQAAVKAFEAEGIPAVHVDAATPDGERERAFDAVADGRIKVLSNVGIVGEGVDVPELSVCQFFCEVNGRVRCSKASAASCVGRPAKITALSSTTPAPSFGWASRTRTPLGRSRATRMRSTRSSMTTTRPPKPSTVSTANWPTRAKINVRSAARSRRDRRSPSSSLPRFGRGMHC